MSQLHRIGSHLWLRPPSLMLPEPVWRPSHLPCRIPQRTGEESAGGAPERFRFGPARPKVSPDPLRRAIPRLLHPDGHSILAIVQDKLPLLCDCLEVWPAEALLSHAAIQACNKDHHLSRPV